MAVQSTKRATNGKQHQTNNISSSGIPSVDEHPAWDNALPIPSLHIFIARLVIFTAAVVCFINSHDGDFVFDDSEAIVGNKDLLPETPVMDILHHDFWGNKLTNLSHKSYRPLTILTYSTVFAVIWVTREVLFTGSSNRHGDHFQHVQNVEKQLFVFRVFRQAVPYSQNCYNIHFCDTDAMPRLSPEQRHQAIGRLDAGQSVQQVAGAFGVNVTTVYRLQQRFHATNSTCDLPRRGRPRVTTARQDRHLVRQHQRDPFETAANTARNTIGVHGQPVSARTVRRRLGGQNLVNRRPARRPVLTAQHRLDRLAWAQQHAHWRYRDWRRVLFSDEKRFCLDPGDGRVRIWRRHGQRFANNNILQHDRWGGASVMIWGAIGVNQRVGPVVFQNVGQGRGNGVNADRYINQVLRPYVVPFVQRHRNCLFQQDNARPHIARATQDFLRHNNVNLLPHPARSPDLNPIEHFWDIMQRRINALARRPRTAAELRAAVTQVWAQVPQQQINDLILSMYRRCAAVINAQGGATRY